MNWWIGFKGFGSPTFPLREGDLGDEITLSAEQQRSSSVEG